MQKQSKMLVVDSSDMIGMAIIAELKLKGYTNVLGLSTDLMDKQLVENYFETNKPEYVFMFAGPHGGIWANINYPADLAYQNMTIQNNLINSCYKYGVKRLLFMVGSCVYPKECPQPMKEQYFMTGAMEPTSAAYSTARAAGIEMCLAYNRQYKTSFIPAILSNCYGSNDDISEKGHVISAVMYKLYKAKLNQEPSVTLFGTGSPQRQFLYVDDLARGAICVMEHANSFKLTNIAGGEECTIAEIANLLKSIVGYNGELIFDVSKPDGAMRKLLDATLIRSLGWSERFSLKEGLELTYRYYLEDKNA